MYMSAILHNGLDREIFDKKALKAFRAVSKFEKFRSLASAWTGVSTLSASRVGALVAPRRLAPRTARKRKLAYQWLFYVVSLRASRIGVETSRAGATHICPIDCHGDCEFCAFG